MKTFIEKIYFLGLIGIIRTIRDFILTGIFVKIGALVRHPFYIRKLGKFNIKSDFRSGPGLVVDILNKSASINIGTNFKVSSRLHIGCIESINIGNNVLIGSDVYISDHAHGKYNGIHQSPAEEIVNDRRLSSSTISIGNNVWIGDKVCILQGVNIGDNSIIGALSLVNKNIESNSIYVGSPARRVKYYDFNVKQWVDDSS